MSRYEYAEGPAEKLRIWNNRDLSSNKSVMIPFNTQILFAWSTKVHENYNPMKPSINLLFHKGYLF